MSGDRRSCATSTTSSSPSGPERRSAKCCDQSRLERAGSPVSIAPSMRRSCGAIDGGERLRPLEEGRAHERRAGGARARCAAARVQVGGSGRWPAARMAPQSCARWAVTSSDRRRVLDGAFPLGLGPERRRRAARPTERRRDRAARRSVRIPQPQRRAARRRPAALSARRAGQGGLGSHSGGPGALVALERRACPSGGRASCGRCSPAAPPSTCCRRRARRAASDTPSRTAATTRSLAAW